MPAEPESNPNPTGSQNVDPIEAPGRPALVDLSANENVLGPSPHARVAARNELDRIHRYPERQSRELLDRLATRHHVGRNQLLLGNGAQHVLRIIAATYLTSDDQAIGLGPTYPGYRNATATMHARYRSIPAESGGYGDLDSWTRAAGRAKLAWLCTPNNPTGCILTQTQAEAILAALPKGSIAVFDETYRDFVDDPNAADGTALLQTGAPVIVVHTFSKLYGLAGLRIGYAIAQPEVIEALLQRLDSFPVNRLAQVAALAALADDEYQDAGRQLVLSGRRQLQQGLERLGIEFYPSQANFVTANFGDQAERVADHIQQSGYVVRPMHGKWELPGWIRITVGLEPAQHRYLKSGSREPPRTPGANTGL